MTHDPPLTSPQIPPSDDTATIDLDPDENKPSRWRWVIDRNPMFLLSGVCMLAGCFLVSRAIHELDPAVVGEGPVLQLLVGLLVVLNVYEFAVIWLGLRLARTQTLVRDARHLLGLALLLVIDAAFVYTETAIFEPKTGVLIAWIATALACLKAWWIATSLSIRVTPAGMAVIATTLAAMYGLPVGVRAMAADGFLSQPQALLVWVMLGAVVALHALPLRWARFDNAASSDHVRLQRLVAGGLVLLPILSLAGHAAAALWVYENAFEPSMTSPLLLGLAAIVLRHHRRLGGAGDAAKAATLVVACAIVPSLLKAQGLTYASPDYTWVAMTPLRGVLLVSPLLLGWAWWIGGRRPGGLANIGLVLTAAALGHTPAAMLGHARWLGERILEWLPTTKLQWGALSIGSAFVCLILGGLWSWLQRQRQARGEDPPDEVAVGRG